MDKSAIVGAVLGTVGGAIATLVGAGVLYPSIEWSPTLTKSSTAEAELRLGPANFDREVLIQVKAEAIASRPKDNSIKIEIAANGELCNMPNEAYKNPTTASVLEAEDFCLFVLPKEKELHVKAGAPNSGADANSIFLSIQTKNVSRPLW